MATWCLDDVIAATPRGGGWLLLLLLLLVLVLLLVFSRLTNQCPNQPLVDDFLSSFQHALAFQPSVFGMIINQ